MEGETTEVNDEVDLSFLDEVPDEDPFVDEQAKAAAAARSKESQEKVKSVIERERAKHEAETEQLITALKSSWSVDAVKEFPLANVEAIPLTGIDDAAREKFMTEVKARHEAEEARLAAAGYVRTDAEGKPIVAAIEQAAETADVEKAKEWGAPVGGSDSQPAPSAELQREILESARQGPRQVIDVLFGRTKIQDYMLRR